MAMIQTNEFVESVVKNLQATEVTRITNMFLLKDWNESLDTPDCMFDTVSRHLIPYGVVARGSSMQVADSFLATFSAIDSKTPITGVALILDGNLTSDSVSTYAPLGTEKVAFVQTIEPLYKPNWDNLYIQVRMYNAIV